MSGGAVDVEPTNIKLTDYDVEASSDYTVIDDSKLAINSVDIKLSAPSIKKNPQRTIPLLDDNGLIIAESRAIAMYLISLYAKDDSLYPRDPQKRVLFDQRLFFDFDVYGAMANVWGSVMSGKPPDHTCVEKVNGGLETWNRILEGRQWLAGDNITLADYSGCLVVTTTQIIPKTDFNPYKYKNVAEWISRIESSSQKYVEEVKVFREATRPILEKVK
ncbi:glutathione S-transferase D5-like [Schistocerca piceifrons]|uniref:glutathione S-transferase D5-like n=1 Tax=Schistocerca piceifrons TaxID=274613 RepID=UPI001F5EC75B|nr:glutathione S-transferase D5-like [Schistocerca piceifrons]